VVVGLARVGIENVKGYLAGGMDAWRRAGHDMTVIPQISVDDLSDLLNSQKDLRVIDVRQPGEYGAGHMRVNSIRIAGRLSSARADFDRARRRASSSVWVLKNCSTCLAARARGSKLVIRWKSELTERRFVQALKAFFDSVLRRLTTDDWRLATEDKYTIFLLSGCLFVRSRQSSVASRQFLNVPIEKRCRSDCQSRLF
jgi:rhodanese-related sulfurtransferase